MRYITPTLYTAVSATYWAGGRQKYYYSAATELWVQPYRVTSNSEPIYLVIELCVTSQYSTSAILSYVTRRNILENLTVWRSSRSDDVPYRLKAQTRISQSLEMSR
ncbi:hypothetical protein Tco_1499585 [Tanacetum coccineum]